MIQVGSRQFAWVLAGAALVALPGCGVRVDQVYRQHQAVLEPMQAKVSVLAQRLPDPPLNPGPAPKLDPKPEASDQNWNLGFAHVATIADPSVWESSVAEPQIYLGSGLDFDAVLRTASEKGASLVGNDSAYEAARIETVAGLRYAILYRYLERNDPSRSSDASGVVATWLIDLPKAEIADSLRVRVSGGVSAEEIRVAWAKRYETRIRGGAPPVFDAIGEAAQASERRLIWGVILAMLVLPLALLKFLNLRMVREVHAFAARFGLAVEENRWLGLAHHPSAQGEVQGRKATYRSYSTGQKGKGTTAVVEVACAATGVPEAALATACQEAGLGSDVTLTLRDGLLAFRFEGTLMTSASERERFTRALEVLPGLASKLEAPSA